MHLLLRSLFTVVYLVAASSASALSRNDLSDLAQRMVPPSDKVVVELNDGTSYSGTLLQETESAYVVNVDRGAIAFERSFAKADVARLVEPNVADALAASLLRFRESLANANADTRFDDMISLLDEFIEKAPTHPRHEDIFQLRQRVAEEQEYALRGMEKIDGEWLPPVQAANRRFDQLEARLLELQERYRDIDQANFSGDPRAREHYQQLLQMRREIIRTLPQVMNERLPLLFEERNFQEAAEEMDTFQKFILNRVAGAEDGPRKHGQDDPRRFASMDLSFIARLHNRFLEAYHQAGGGNEQPRRVPDQPGMSLVPGGYFLRGHPDAGPTDNTFPAQIVYVAPFLLDDHEVTNAEYREFLEHVQSSGDYSMAHPDAPPLKDHTPQGWQHEDLSHDDQPVVGVDWFDAYAYATWAGKRLPTEAEWERAARGNDQRIYPWGTNLPSRVMVNTPSGRSFINGEIAAAQGTDRLRETTWTVATVSPPEAEAMLIAANIPPHGPFGHLHLAGNAAEWVADWYRPNHYLYASAMNPAGPDDGSGRVVRGGHYRSPDPEITTYHRTTPDTSSSFRGGRQAQEKPMIGFRCAVSIP